MNGPGCRSRGDNKDKNTDYFWTRDADAEDGSYVQEKARVGAALALGSWATGSANVLKVRRLSLQRWPVGCRPLKKEQDVIRTQ